MPHFHAILRPFLLSLHRKNGIMIMKKIFAAIVAMAFVCGVRAQELVRQYPDDYRSDAQYRVARALDPLMGKLGESTVAQLLDFERLDAVDAIGDRGRFAMRSGVEVIPGRADDGAFDLGVKPAYFIYEYAPYDEYDCMEMISFFADRYSPSAEPINPCEVIEAGSVDLPVPTGTLRITASPERCAFILLPAE